MMLTDILDDIMKTNQWTSSSNSGGKYVQMFEKELSKYIGRETLTVNSGTSALITALHCAGVRKDDHVVIPAYSFRATRNAVIALGAKPVLADIKLDDFTIDPERIEINGRVKAIIAVHLYGNIADIRGIRDVLQAHKRNMPIIEDACQAFGSVGAGTLGDFGCFSFYPTKMINTMEGGAVSVNSPVDVQNVRLFRNHGMANHGGEELWGLNLRMPEFNAGMGLLQMKNIGELISERRTSYVQWYTMLKDKGLNVLPLQKESNGSIITFLTEDREKWMNEIPATRKYYDYTLADNDMDEGRYPNALYASEHSLSIDTRVRFI